MPKPSCLFLSLLSFAVSFWSVQGSGETVYRYDFATGVLSNSYSFEEGLSAPHGPGAPSELEGLTLGEFVQTGRAWGTGHSTLIKAFDWVQNYRVNYLTSGGGSTWYFDITDNTNGRQAAIGSTVFVDGPYEGQNILGNSHILALDDARVLLYNPEAIGETFLSLYEVESGSMSFIPFGFSAFSGTGAMSGSTFALQLGNFIGAENGLLYYLDPDGSFSAYGINSGATVLDPTWTIFSGGLFDGFTLEEALLSGHYLGLGNGTDFYFTASVIPEPSAALLLLAGGAAFIASARSRKQQVKRS